MRTTTVVIDGQSVAIPSHELPHLIITLTNKYQELLISGDITGTPTDDFMSYDQAEQILSEHYDGKKLRYHTGRVWGAMCRMTTRSHLHFDTKCSLCGSPVEHKGEYHGKRCHHMMSGAVGYRLILIGPVSMRVNYVKMQTSTMKTIGQAIKNDYTLIVDAISR